jgi:hypothetical protein
MGLEAAGLYAMGLSYAAAHLTDGYLPASWVDGLVGRKRKITETLLTVRAWEFDEQRGGYLIVDFLDYNPSRLQIQENRLKTRERVTRFRGKRNAVGNGGETGPIDVGPVLGPGNTTDALLDFQKEVYEYAENLKDRNEQTVSVLAALRASLPEGAFRTAMEALAERRKRTPPLVSESRYFVATLQSMIREGRY